MLMLPMEKESQVTSETPPHLRVLAALSFSDALLDLGYRA